MDYLIFSAIVLLIVFSAFMIARKIYRVLLQRNNKWAVAVGIFSFITSCLIISVAIIAIVAYNVEIGR